MNLHMTLYGRQRTLRYKVPDNQVIKISSRFILHPWRRITTSSVLFEKYPPERAHLNNKLINGDL